MTDQWPPPGYSMAAIGLSRFACCDRCGALVGNTALHDKACEAGE